MFWKKSDRKSEMSTRWRRRTPGSHQHRLFPVTLWSQQRSGSQDVPLQRVSSFLVCSRITAAAQLALIALMGLWLDQDTRCRDESGNRTGGGAAKGPRVCWARMLREALDKAPLLLYAIGFHPFWSMWNHLAFPSPFYTQRTLEMEF